MAQHIGAGSAIAVQALAPPPNQPTIWNRAHPHVVVSVCHPTRRAPVQMQSGHSSVLSLELNVHNSRYAGPCVHTNTHHVLYVFRQWLHRLRQSRAEDSTMHQLQCSHECLLCPGKFIHDCKPDSAASHTKPVGSPIHHLQVNIDVKITIPGRREILPWCHQGSSCRRMSLSKKWI